MRKILKKAAAAILAGAMCLSLAGCYNENNTWAAKKGDDTLPIGGYIYYLNSAYSEARGKVASGEEVTKATIEDKDAKTWIADRALNYLNAYYYIADKFDALGLELSEEEQDTAQSTTDTMWTYYKSTMEAMGIAKESFHKASTVYGTKYQKVMEAMYGAGGEMEIPEDELKSYYTENYYTYEYFSASLTKTDDDGNSVDMTNEEKADAKSKLEGYVDDINGGDTTVQDAASKYAEDALGGASNSTYQAPSPTKADSIPVSAIKDAVQNGKDNEAVLVESDTAYYVVRKLSIEDKFEEVKADDTQKFSLISDMKSDEFSDYVEEQAKSVEGVEINQGALNSVSLSKLISDDNKNGTSSAASEAGSDGASSAAESSGETSSTVESSTSSESSSSEE